MIPNFYFRQQSLNIVGGGQFYSYSDSVQIKFLSFAMSQIKLQSNVKAGYY